MLTRPSTDDILEGVVKSLEHIVLPDLGEPAAAEHITGVLVALDRVAAEWEGVVRHLVVDNDDIDQTLRRVERLVTPGMARFARQGLDALPTAPPPASPVSHAGAEHLSAGELSERNRRLKDALVWTIEALNLPPCADSAPAVREADREVRQLLARMLQRELDATPGLPPRINPTGGAGDADRPEDVAVALHHFLADQMPEAQNICVVDLDRMAGGASREAWRFTVTWEAGGQCQREDCVMLRHPVSSVLESDESEARITGSRRLPQTEFKMVQLMEAQGIPVPHMLWIDADGKWLERPFSVSRWLPGDSDVTALLGTDRASRILEQYIEILARLHNIEPEQAGVDFLGHPTAETAALEQIQLFEEGYNRQRLEDVPTIAYMIRWLKQHQPIATRVSVVHGDFRLGNFMYEGHNLVAMLDWEQCHLGDPLEEIAFMYWALWSLEGFIPISDFIRRYEQASGITVDREALAFYRVFIELKMCVVLLTGIKSFFATPYRQLKYGSSAGNRMLTDCQLRFLNELASGGPTVEFRGGPALSVSPGAG